MKQPPAIPEELKSYRQFVTWRLEHRPNDPKPTKVPQGSTTDPTTWKSYDEALLDLYADPSLSGIGFVFTDDDPFVFFDIDGCATPDGTAWHADALAFVQSMPGVSWEVSQSGKGLHGIARADKSKLTRKRNKFTTPAGIRCEFYTSKRYMAIGRGDWTLPVPVDATKYFLELIPDREETVDTTDDLIDGPRPGYTGPRSDDELIDRARKSRGSAAQAFGSAASFDDLWTANGEALAAIFPNEDGTGFDHSSADAALMERLAFWTGYDEVRMIRLFDRSSLAQRDKWKKRPDYRARTVKAVTGRQNARYIGSDKSDRATSAKVQSQAVTDAPRETFVPPAVQPDKSDHNYIMRVLHELGAKLTYNEFSYQVMLNGVPIEDRDYLSLWMRTRDAAADTVSKQLAYDVIDYLALRNHYHPVKDYLESVGATWDGTPRLDTWLVDYASAPDTPYVRAAGSKALIGAIRRIYEPGCKHDEMLVFEGPQNSGKSTLVRSLCADPAWFSDSVTLNMESKELIEVTQGRWFVEAPELSRLTGAEAEHVKALLSRAEDVARLAYGRGTTTRKRQFVIIGTTNEDTYLQDTTGNRRFLPIKTGTIDVDGLIEARDQIFAEAVQRYRQGETNELPGDVLDEARREQEARQFENEYIDQLEDLLRDKTGSISMSVLYSILEIPPARRRGASRFIKSAMQSLGWTLYDRSWIKGSPHRKWKALGTVLTEASPDLKVMPR